MKLIYLMMPMFFLTACHPGFHQELGHSKSDKEVFGQKVTGKKSWSLAKIKDELQTKDTIYTTTLGDVNKVCQKKGCWMTIKPLENEEPVFTVRFKDYGFFVPKDISGNQVVVQGKAFRQITDVESLKHYAKDAGKSEADIALITEPREEWIFIADGVELYREIK